MCCYCHLEVNWGAHNIMEVQTKNNTSDHKVILASKILKSSFNFDTLISVHPLWITAVVSTCLAFPTYYIAKHFPDKQSQIYQVRIITEGQTRPQRDKVLHLLILKKKDEECPPPSHWHCTSSSVTLCLVLKTNYWGAEICGALLQTKGFKTQWRSTGKSQSWGTTLTILSRPPAPNTQKTTSFSVHAARYLNIYELSPPAVKKLLINYSSHKSWTKVPSNCQNAFKNPSVLNITV